MKTAVMNFKTEPAIKEGLRILAKKLGVSVSFIIDRAVRETLSKGTVAVQEYIPNEETIRAIEEAIADRAAGRISPVAHSIEELREQLENLD